MTTTKRKLSVFTGKNGELPPELNVRTEEFHCSKCGRFLGFQAIVEGTIVVKCKTCKEWVALDVRGIVAKVVDKHKNL